MTRGQRRRMWLFAGIATLGFFAFHGSSRAASGPSLDGRVTWSASGVPRVSVDATPLADAALGARLASGLPTTLVLRIAAFEDDEVIATASITCHAIYDAWQRRFEVRVHDAVTIAPDVDHALGACLDVEDASVGEASEWRGRARRRVSFVVAVDVNPITERTERSLSTWLTRSGGGTGEPTFFGAFVGAHVFPRGDVERSLGTHPLRPIASPASSSGGRSP